MADLRAALHAVADALADRLDAGQCPAIFQGYSCALAAGHKGCHQEVAGGGVGGVIWNDGAPPNPGIAWRAGSLGGDCDIRPPTVTVATAEDADKFEETGRVVAEIRPPKRRKAGGDLDHRPRRRK